MQAATFTFPFTSPGNPLGTSQAYTVTVGSSSATITASSLVTVTSGFSQPDLYAKNGGTDETGLGLTGDPSGDDEIIAKDAIVLDFSAIANITSITIEMGSVQSPDTWSLYGSNTKPTQDVALSTPSDNQTLLLSNQTTDQEKSGTPLLIYNTSFDPTLYKYYTITEGCATGNVLLGSINVTTGAPEPASFGMMGLACGILLLTGRKLRRA
jgi:hypothetical protein